MSRDLLKKIETYKGGYNIRLLVDYTPDLFNIRGFDIYVPSYLKFFEAVGCVLRRVSDGKLFMIVEAKAKAHGWINERFYLGYRLAGGASVLKLKNLSTGKISNRGLRLSYSPKHTDTIIKNYEHIKECDFRNLTNETLGVIQNEQNNLIKLNKL